MTQSLQQYLEELQNKYKEELVLSKSDIQDDILEKVPNVLHDLYRIASQINFPFGRIWPIEMALKESERAPFQSKWFVFGKDNFFTFWLCSYTKDQDGLSFTAWDHESGCEIGDPVDADIVDFLRFEEEEYAEYKESYDAYEEDQYDEDEDE